MGYCLNFVILVELENFVVCLSAMDLFEMSIFQGTISECFIILLVLGLLALYFDRLVVLLRLGWRNSYISIGVASLGCSDTISPFSLLKRLRSMEI